MWSVVQLSEKKQRAAAFSSSAETDESNNYGAHVWVPDEQRVWAVANVISEKENTLLVDVPDEKGGPFEVPRKHVHQYDPSHALDLDDASKMNGMHEGPLLDLLLRRFRHDKIYTNMADVLVSINPYKQIPLLYEIPLLQMQDDSEEEFEESDGEEDILNKNKDNIDQRPEAMRRKLKKPHVHSIADRAFRFMTEPGSEYQHGKARCLNQSIIITGESGAGKTEASKYVMRYLITAAQLLIGLKSDDPVDAMAKRIEAVLMESNTILEAFGNAKTLRNDNSSRFGKYIKLQYDNTFNLVGARTEHFLLEKSRLVRVDRAERGYHIFYQLCCGLPEDQAEKLKIPGPQAFKGITQGGCIEVGDDVDDGKEFMKTRHALKTLGFSDDEVNAMWRLLAAILHMGNVSFHDLERGEGSVGGENQTSMVSGKLISLDELSDLLGLEGDVLQNRVVRRAMSSIRGSSHEIPLNSSQAKDNLDGLVKHVYGNLFAWIVWKINQCHREQVASTSGRNFHNAGDFSKSFIGILDIFGFEIMTTNSFEQLCINFANEVLQRQFNYHVFVLEQQEYAAEGLDVSAIPFNDNQTIIDLISKKPLGLMPILEDQGLTGRKAHALNNLTDKKLLDLYHQAHHRNNPHPNYEKPRFENDQFILRHFAGSVTYDVAGFLEKNNDSLQGDLRMVLMESSDSLVRNLVSISDFEEFEKGNEIGANRLEYAPQHSPNWGRKAGDKKLASASTVSQTFRKQLDTLVEQLSATEPHYIKCIKPNTVKAPGGWNSPLVIQQLRYSGVLEVVRIRREAFPTRISFVEFCNRFGQLISWSSRNLAPPEELSQDILRTLCSEICHRALESSADFQLGSRKVFLKDDGLDRIRWALQQHFVAIATGVQRRWRGFVTRKRVAREKVSAVQIQRVVRGHLARKLAAQLAEEKRIKFQNSAVLMQAYVRRMLAKKWTKLAVQRAQLENDSAITVQKIARGYIARKEYTKARQAAITLQAMARGMATRKQLAIQRAQLENESAITIQRIARGYIARMEYMKHRDAAIILQSMARGMAARKLFCSLKTQDRLRREREARKATKIEAWWRMVMAKKELNKSRAAATRIQATVRGYQARAEFNKAKKAVVTLQSFARMVKGRRSFLLDMRHIIKIQALARGMIARRAYRKAILAVRRIQRAGQAYVRNKYLEKCVKRLYNAAVTGDSNTVTAGITAWPALLFVRNRYDEGRTFNTLVHAACEYGQLDIVALLEPFPEDVFSRNKLGNTPLHYAAGNSHYNLCKYLARRANMDVEATISREDKKMAEINSLSNRKVRSNINIFKQMRTERAREQQREGNTKANAKKTKSGYDESTLLMAGYLKKRRETDRWMKRWCVLTETHLMYFHKKTDHQPSKAIRLDSAMLKKSEHVNFAFELHTPNLLDNRNREGRLYFQAESEGVLQTWLVPLRMVVGLYQFRLDKRREPIEYLDVNNRKAMVRVANKAGETPLHMTAKAKSPKSQSPLQQVSAWLIESGAGPNAIDNQGQSALHVAASCNNASLVLTLSCKGGDLHLQRSKDNARVIDLVNGESNLQTVLQLQSVPSERFPLLKPPEKLYGFTYLSFMIEKTTLTSTEELVMPAVSITVYNAKGQQSEEQQDLILPCLTRPGYFWWAQTWHMQTPLETIGENSVVIFELRDLVDAKKARTVAWGVYRLDLDDMNTRSEMMNMYNAPVDLTMKRLETADVFIQGEVMLTQGIKKKNYDNSAASKE